MHSFIQKFLILSQFTSQKVCVFRSLQKVCFKQRWFFAYILSGLSFKFALTTLHDLMPLSLVIMLTAYQTH